MISVKERAPFIVRGNLVSVIRGFHILTSYTENFNFVLCLFEVENNLATASMGLLLFLKSQLMVCCGVGLAQFSLVNRQISSTRSIRQLPRVPDAGRSSLSLTMPVNPVLRLGIN